MVKMILKMEKMILIKCERKAARIPFEKRGVLCCFIYLIFYLLAFNTTVNVNIIVSGS